MKKLLKLTGGSYAGRRLYVPDSGVRPATNKVREALFSTLLTWFPGGVQGLAVLDLFAGTGSLGLEAISRGASRATFVDSSSQSVRSIRENLKILGFSGRVFRSAVKDFLRRSGSLDYDLVFMDPPYRYTGNRREVELLLATLAARDTQVLVHERRYRAEAPDFEELLEPLKRRRYGQTELLYYRFPR
jgi:16S rRNA (guanine966-N2)-methyltransferase